ncbi:MAG: T9SS type A sorting domain-containing protein, partial [Bacteroidales bacterium]
LLLVTGFQVVAQDSTFFKTYNFDPGCGNKTYAIIKTPDGGMILGGGYACEFFTNDWMYFKTDTYGDVEWFTNYESVNSPDFHDLIITPGDEIFSVGDYWSFIGNDGGGYYPGIAKVSPDGDSLWWKTNSMEGYDTCSYDEGEYRSISMASDGNLLLSGTKDGCMHGNRLLLSKITPDGETLWLTTDTLYNGGFYHGWDVLQASNSNIYIAGWGHNLDMCYDAHDCPAHAILSAYNEDGEFEFSKIFYEETEAHQTQGYSIIELDDKLVLGSLYVNIFDNNYTFHPLFYVLDYQGNINKKVYLNLNAYANWTGFVLHSIEKTSDGGFVAVGGGGYRPNGTEYGWMARFNANADMLWYKTLGDTTGQEFFGRIYDVVELDGGRLAFAGSKKIYPENAESFLLVTDSWGNGNYPSFEMQLDTQTTEYVHNCLIYPNPATEYIWIDPESCLPENYTIYDVAGRPVIKGTLSGKTKLDISNFTQGLYIFKSKTCESQRIIIY